MPLPATDNFTGTTGDAVNGRTTTTGGLTWASNGFTILGNTAWTTSAGSHAIVDAGTANVKVSAKIVGSNPNFWALIFRCNSGFTQYLACKVTTANVYIYDDTGALLASGAGTFAVNDTIEVDANGSSITVLQNGTIVLTHTSSHGLTNTFVGLQADFNSNQFDDFSVDAFSLATPTAVLSYATPASMVFAGTTGTGGTGPYTQQWMESPTPNGTFTNVANGGGVSGATTLTLTDGRAGLTRGTVYYRKLRVTDSLAATFDSNAQAGSLWNTPVVPGWIGDSQTAPGNGHAVPPPDWFAFYVAALGYERAVTWTNANGATTAYGTNLAAGGTATNDWKAGSSNLTAAISAFNAAGVTDVFVNLLTNDAFAGVAAATAVDTNLAGMVAPLFAGVATLQRVWFCYPSAWGTAAGVNGAGALAVLQGYLSHLDALDNGTTVQVISKDAFRVFGDRQDALLNGNGTPDLHLNANGAQVRGMLDALSFVRAMGEVSGAAPSAGDLRSGVTVGAVTGTLALPTQPNVKSGVHYGAGGTEFTGSYSGGGGGGSGGGGRLSIGI